MMAISQVVCPLAVLVTIFLVEIDCQTTIAPPKPTTPKLTVAQNLNKAAMECQSRLNVNQAFMSLLSTKNIPTNEKMRCFLLCVYESLGLVKDNKFQAPQAKYLAEQRYSGEELTKAIQLIEVCDEVIQMPDNPTEFCTLGRLVRTCFKEEGDKINFFPKA